MRFFGICPRIHGLVASCLKPRTLDAVFEMWKEPCVARCIGKPRASGMVGTEAGFFCVYVVASNGSVFVKCRSQPRFRTTRKEIESVRFGEHLSPLSLYQASCDIVLMFSWYSDGCGWRMGLL